MIKENQKLFNAINVISDALLSVVAVVASFVIVFYLLAFERNFLLIDYIKLSCIFIPVQLVTYSCMGLYESYRTATFGKELAKLVSAFFIDGLLIIAMLYIVKLFDFSRWALAIFLVLDLVFVAVKRVVMRYILRGLRRKGHNQKHVLLIGGGAAALNYLETIRAEKQLGINCVGYLADRDSLDAKWLGGFDDIIKLLDGNCYDDVVCALDMNEMRYMQSVVEACEITGTRVSVIPAMYKYMSPTSVIDMVGGIPVMNIRRIPLDNMGNAFLKRAMDIIVSLIMLILFSPVMLVCAIVIKATDYKESDRIITLFSAEEGKTSAVMRGVKKKDAKMKFAGQLFNYGEYEIIMPSGTVSGCNQKDSFFSLTSDYEAFLAACVVAEVLSGDFTGDETAQVLLPRLSRL